MGEVPALVEPLRTARLVLRAPETRDRPAVVELAASEQVRAHLGGARPREEVERAVPTEPNGEPGTFVVELDGAAIGLVTLDRRDADRPGHVVPGGGEVELGYLLLPGHWGQGYAAEASAAVLGWCEAELPGEPVVLCTQTANARSVRLARRLGFAEVERFEEFGAEQWFGVRRPGGRVSAAGRAR